MSFSSKFLLFLSFIILFFNGSSISFILYDVRLGAYFGNGLFILSSLAGVLFASIAEVDAGRRGFYCKYCMYGNLLISFYPLYFHLIGMWVFPSLLR
ncbi:hypothetical protein [Fredinandcohnia quinoae]|uniref:Uncharacterized protein n=1 Tax=Fredinandcohnia quinoae TaxID=2918902 RepID=A0AAW5E4E0_9BACI|nr:hypothetical protein [Fredinandcohnia sp. SECRCQ15]MCH1627810.1 hypothetical protein [Fredinandcohnia sp. SECRCQ15]